MYGGGAGEAGAPGSQACLDGTAQCLSDSEIVQDCVSGHWIERTCTGATPSCFRGDCVQCIPGISECSGYDLRTCTSTGVWALTSCANGCLNARCLSEPASQSPGIVQCDIDVVCPSHQVCCLDTTTRTGRCADECEEMEGVQGPIECDGKNDCDELYDCCAYQYDGEWMRTACNLCRAPVTELLVRSVCQSDADCSPEETCQVLTPTKTTRVCQ